MSVTGSKIHGCDWPKQMAKLGYNKQPWLSKHPFLGYISHRLTLLVGWEALSCVAPLWHCSIRPNTRHLFFCLQDKVVSQKKKKKKEAETTEWQQFQPHICMQANGKHTPTQNICPCIFTAVLSRVDWVSSTKDGLARGMLFCYKEKWSIENLLHNIDRSWKLYTKWKKKRQKPLPYDSIFIKIQKRQSIQTDDRSTPARCPGRGGGRVTADWWRFPFEMIQSHYGILLEPLSSVLQRGKSVHYRDMR